MRLFLSPSSIRRFVAVASACRMPVRRKFRCQANSCLPTGPPMPTRLPLCACSDTDRQTGTSYFKLFPIHWAWGQKYGACWLLRTMCEWLRIRRKRRSHRRPLRTGNSLRHDPSAKSKARKHSIGRTRAVVASWSDPSAPIPATPPTTSSRSLPRPPHPAPHASARRCAGSPAHPSHSVPPAPPQRH